VQKIEAHPKNLIRKETHMDKSTLLNNIRTKQAELDELLSSLSEEQMTTPGVNGEWSIKDILAHMVEWQHVLLKRLHAAIYGGEPGIAMDYSIDETNEQFYQKNRERSLADVQADYKQSYQRILEGIEKLSDEDLNDPHRFSWWDGEPFWKSVAGDTYEHIDEHIGSIRDWLDAWSLLNT
jgi:hypothetical protein